MTEPENHEKQPKSKWNPLSWFRRDNAGTTQDIIIDDAQTDPRKRKTQEDEAIHDPEFYTKELKGLLTSLFEKIKQNEALTEDELNEFFSLLYENAQEFESQKDTSWWHVVHRGLYERYVKKNQDSTYVEDYLFVNTALLDKVNHNFFGDPFNQFENDAHSNVLHAEGYGGSVETSQAFVRLYQELAQYTTHLSKPDIGITSLVEFLLIRAKSIVTEVDDRYPNALQTSKDIETVAIQGWQKLLQSGGLSEEDRQLCEAAIVYHQSKLEELNNPTESLE